MRLPTPLDGLGPVMIAPMAGGPGRPQLVVAAGRAGAFAQVAAGYLTPDALRAQIRQVREAGIDTFGVNLFAPDIHRISARDYATYAAALTDDLAAGEPVAELRQDDDAWKEKIEVVIDEQVPLVSRTFGLGDDAAQAALAAAGIPVIQTVTNAAEARAAEAAGSAALVVQSSAAGGHSGVWAADAIPPDVPLVSLIAQVRSAVGLPIIAAGGIMRRTQVDEALAAGASAVQVGTAALLATEAGTNDAHRAALGDPRFAETTLTRVFTGRYARALRNDFTDRHPDAPSGYPALHHLTRPMRARAVASGDAERVHLWAGKGWREAREAPIAEILRDLTP